MYIIIIIGILFTDMFDKTIMIKNDKKVYFVVTLNVQKKFNLKSHCKYLLGIYYVNMDPHFPSFFSNCL